MNKSEKYNFKIINENPSIDALDFHEKSEIDLIDCFEKNTIDLKKYESPYVMIEVGSNIAYYSLLFKHILGKEKTINIMIEPHPPSLELGENNFKLNNCSGFFYKRGIGKEWTIQPDPNLKNLTSEPILLSEIFETHELNCIDVLHSDIDGSELTLLDENKNLFVKKQIKHVYILTHSDSKHDGCKKFFQNLDYNLILDIPYSEKKVGYDGLLVYRIKND